MVNHNMSRTMFISLVLDLLAFTLILPLLPAIIENYGRKKMTPGDEPADSLYTQLDNMIDGVGVRLGVPGRFNNVLFGGLIGSLFSFLQFLCSPLFGALSDVYGRRPLLLLSAFGLTISNLIWANSSTFTLFIIARTVGGLAKGNISLATSVMADIYDVQHRAKGMALVGIAFSVGFICGPMIGAMLSIWIRISTSVHQSLAFQAPALVSTALSAINLIYLAVSFEETLPATKRTSKLSDVAWTVVGHTNPVSLFKFNSLQSQTLVPAQRQQLSMWGTVYFLYLFFYSGLEFTLTFLTHSKFQFSSMEQGKMFLGIGLTMTVIQGGYVRRLTSLQTLRRHVQFALILIIPSFALVGNADSRPVLYAGVLLYAVSTAICVPCITSLVSMHGDPSDKGVILGLFRSIGALARAFGPICACCAYWMFGALATYTIGGLCMLLPFAFTIRIGDHQMEKLKNKMS